MDLERLLFPSFVVPWASSLARDHIHGFKDIELARTSVCKIYVADGVKSFIKLLSQVHDPEGNERVDQRCGPAAKGVAPASRDGLQLIRHPGMIFVGGPALDEGGLDSLLSLLAQLSIAPRLLGESGLDRNRSMLIKPYRSAPVSLPSRPRAAGDYLQTWTWPCPNHYTNIGDGTKLPV